MNNSYTTSENHFLALEEVSQAVTSILDLDLLLEKLALLIQEYFGYPFVHIFLIQPDKNQIYFASGSGDRAKAYQDAKISYDISSKGGIISHVARERKMRCINDVKTDIDFLPNPFTGEVTGSELTIPLLFNKQILGVLDVQSPEINAFSAEEISILVTLAANVTVAIRNAKLYRSEVWRRKIAESLRDVAIKIAGNLNSDQIQLMILDEISEILPNDIASIWLNKSQADLNFADEATIFELSNFKLSNETSFSPSKMVGLKATNDSWFCKKSYVLGPAIRDITSGYSDPLATALDLPQNYSAIAAPLIISGNLLGLLILHHHLPGKFGVESQNVTASFAGFSAISIDNSRLLEASQKQAWISTVLLQTANLTQSVSTIAELTSTVTRLTPLLAGVQGCGIFLREEDSDSFALHAIYGNVFTSTLIEDPVLIENAPSLDNMLLTGSPSLVIDPSSELNLPEPLNSDLQQKTIVLLPLKTQNTLSGAFLVIKDQPFAGQDDEILNDETLMIIQGIAQLTATAAENIRLSEARQEEAYISTILLQVAQEVVSNKELDEILDSIVTLLPRIVGINNCVLYMIDQQTQSIIPKYYSINVKTGLLSDELANLTYQLGDFPIIDELLTTQQALINPLITELNPSDWDLILVDENYQSNSDPMLKKNKLIFAIPLIVNGEVSAVLLADERTYSPRRKKRFELINGIAKQATLAIQNDIYNQNLILNERLNREFQLAREIQKTFLPEELPKIQGYESHVLWKTARQVGGDFYDIFPLSNKDYGILIADVSDKGLAASLYMAVTRTVLRLVATEQHSPAVTLEKVNDFLMDNSQKGLFVTIFYGILNTETGVFRYTNAGHNPPYLINNDTGSLIELPHGDIAIGVMPDIKLHEYDLQIDPGDYLLMHTDGVTEAFNPAGNFFGESRYKKILSRNAGISPEKLLEKIEAELTRFRQTSSLGDDTTLLAVRRNPLLAE